jgi:hypothetical protein
MIRKDFEGNCRSLSEVLSQYLPGETEENREKNPANVVDVSAEIRTGHLPNMYIEGYSCTKVLGVKAERRYRCLSQGKTKLVLC